MIVGRKKEQSLLEKAYNSREAEFIVLYGRRRIGKTYLVHEFFRKKKCLFFHATGLQKGTSKNQLKKFAETLSKTFFDNVALECPKNWHEAFGLLHTQIAKAKTKVVLFLDELPWMATKKSGLLEEIDYYWNHHFSRSTNIILVICGSSASWLIDKVIYNKGGLHNRVTCQIKLSPFTLLETKEYLKNRKIKLNDKHILTLYMALGGIPYYLRYIEAGLTAQQNIQRLIFDQNAPLEGEFEKLFSSLFERADAYIELVKIIAKRKEGVRRAELKELAQLSTSGGRLSTRLNDLCETGFIEEYIPWNRNKGEYYRLIDEFCLFYLYWVNGQKNKKFTADHWLNQSQKPSYYAWSGYAFEAICMKHSDPIIRALDIKASSAVASWSFVPRKKKESGAQIDLIIERNDNAMTLCEIKYTEQPFAIDKEYAEKLKRKMDIFKKVTRTEKQLFWAMISANGIKSTLYSAEMIDGVVLLEDLFQPKR